MRIIILISLFFGGVSLGVSQSIKEVVLTDWIIEPSVGEKAKPLVFVDFWATWCGPCIHSMTYTQQLQKEYKEHILFVYLSDENPDKIKGFMERGEKTFFSATDETRKNFDEYGVRSLPHSVLLGPNGEVLWQGNPTDMKRSTLGKLSERYKNKEGSATRFYEVPKEDETSKIQMFNYLGDTLWYEIDSLGVNSESHEGGMNTVSGNIKNIMAYAYGVPGFQINSDSIYEAFSFSNESTTDSTFKDLILGFLNTKYTIDTVVSNESVFLVTQGDSLSFLDQTFYDYELGYMAYMEDGISLMVDDARPKDAFKLLSDISAYPFIYEGDNVFVYDWSFFYGKRESLFDQLTNELSFKVAYEKREMMIYKISPK